MNISKMLKASLCACALLLAGCGSEASSAAQSLEKQSLSLFAMDTYMTLSAYGDNAGAALEAASGEITRLEAQISVTAPGSEIYSLNAAGSAELSEDTEELLRFALEMNQRTAGALDVTLYPVTSSWGFTKEEHHVPTEEELSSLLALTGPDKLELNGTAASLSEGSQIDLGAVGKGYAGDLAAEALKENGVTSALLDLGGNIQTVGTKPDGSLWKIGIRDPFSDGVFGTLTIGEAAVVTSGAYERFFVEDGVTYWHIIDPTTGKPASSGVASATIVGSEGRLCDALSTSAFVMGKDRTCELWRQNDDFDYIIVTDERQVYISEGLSESFALSDSCSDWELIVDKK